MQSIPEHPKRDFIFCLSTAFGDAYLFQVIANEGQKEKGIQSGYLITKKVLDIRTTEYSNPVRGTYLAYVRIPVFFKQDYNSKLKISFQVAKDEFLNVLLKTYL